MKTGNGRFLGIPLITVPYVKIGMFEFCLYEVVK